MFYIVLEDSYGLLTCICPTVGYRRALTSRLPKDLTATFVRDDQHDDDDPVTRERRNTMMMNQPFAVSKDELSYGGAEAKGKHRISVTIPSHSEKLTDDIEIFESPGHFEPLKGGREERRGI